MRKAASRCGSDTTAAFKILNLLGILINGLLKQPSNRRRQLKREKEGVGVKSSLKRTTTKMEKIKNKAVPSWTTTFRQSVNEASSSQSLHLSEDVARCIGTGERYVYKRLKGSFFPKAFSKFLRKKPIIVFGVFFLDLFLGLVATKGSPDPGTSGCLPPWLPHFPDVSLCTWSTQVTSGDLSVTQMGIWRSLDPGGSLHYTTWVVSWSLPDSGNL